MKTWNNRKNQLPNGKFKLQDWWYDILDEVEVGDLILTDNDGEYLCTIAMGSTNKDGSKVANEGKNAFIELRTPKQDGTPHMGRKAIYYIFSDKNNEWVKR